MDYLDSLDKEQLKAATASAGPLKVVAGAGSGKTRVLTCRVAHMIDTKVVNPEEMFVSAFTKAAAEEMAERVEKLVVADGLKVGTFHSLMFRLLQDERRLNAIPPIQVCKESERTRILQGLLGKPGKDYPQAINADVDLGNVGSFIGTWKNELIVSDAQEIKQTVDDAPLGSDIRAAALIYPLYDKQLQMLGKLDFDDMLLHAYLALAHKKDVLARARKKWSAFLIDEAQDTNHAQWEIMKLLAPPSTKPNLTIVGDTRQCLYRFRGAIPELMDNFETFYKGAEVINMTKNYRSVNAVVDHSNRLIKSLDLPAQKANRAQGRDPITVEFLDQSQQAVELAEFVTEARDSGYKGGDIAVLIRTNAQSAEIETAFVAAKLPYWCRNGGFFDRMEIGDIMNYLRLAMDHTNAEALGRIINKPTRYLGKVYVEQVVENAKRYDGDLIQAMYATERYKGKRMFPKQIDAAYELASLIETITPTEGALINPTQAIMKILERTDYIDWLRKTSGTDAGTDDSRKENIDALLEVTLKYGSIKTFLDFVDEATRLQLESNDATEISTVHRAKGREWPIVFCSNFYNESIPHKMAIREGGAQGIQDERRVAYVAFTRAQDLLVIGVPRLNEKGEEVRPSPFLNDADLEVKEREDDAPWWGNFLSPDRAESSGTLPLG